MNINLPFKTEMSLRKHKNEEPLKAFYEALYFTLHWTLYRHLEGKNVIRKKPRAE